ncbi:dCTP deaminase [Streptomyces canus]|uniref:dCTP deaminase n=1 Tax=Streptomyces canus TaxID=58343 RepID=UPI0036E6F5CB
MILSDKGIRTSLGEGALTITPFDDRLVKRNSYLLRLHTAFRRIDTDAVLDTADPDALAAAAGRLTEADSIVLTPDSLVLGCSAERLGLAADMVGLLSGVSDLARLGVQIHCTSQLVNAGFAHSRPSRVVFELSTVGGRKVLLHAGTPICHLVLFTLCSPTTYPHPSGRTGQDGPEPSRLLQQFGHFYAAEPPSPSLPA